MFDTITRYLEGITNVLDRGAMRNIVTPMADKFSSRNLNQAGLVISAGGAATAKIGATDFYAVANGVIVKIAASTTLPALTGLNISAGAFNIFCFFVDQGGTVTVLMGTEGATLGAIKWPQFPQGKALIGEMIVTYASAFTGGTTALDTATTVYLTSVGGMDPTILI